MSDLERALRAAFVHGAPAEPPVGFEARMARAALARGRPARMLPGLLAAVVAAAAIATLLTGRGRGAVPAPSQPPAAGSVTEVWQLVIELRRRLSWSVPDERDDQPVVAPPVPPAPREHAPSVRRPIDQVDCGDDPLCPLVAPSAARVSLAAAGGPARVTLDGQDAGTTPLDIDVIPGEHMFVVRWDDGREKKVFATLRSGDHRSIRVSRPR